MNLSYKTPESDEFAEFIKQRKWEVRYRLEDESTFLRSRKVWRISYRKGETYPWMAISAMGETTLEAAEKAAELALIAVGERKPKDAILNREE